jgi:cation diffusion facilitator family transporter
MPENQRISQREKLSRRAVSLGLAANILLAALKTSIGIIGHSPALLADGINSVSDVAYYVVVAVFMRLAQKPADDEHPFGHRQMESIAALAVGAFVITTAIAIFWDAINKIFDQWVNPIASDDALPIALVVALGTIMLKIALALATQRIGQQTHNPAILALAYDHRNDIFAASAAAIGIFFGQVGYDWVDPLAGAFVAVIILRTGIEIMRESSDDLMDTIPGKALKQDVNEIALQVPGVCQVETILAHRFGPYLMINLTIGIDGEISVAQGDCIATELEQALMDGIDLLQRVHIHYHPTS